ncbi:MAG: pectate lyase [Planctomycetota bacterium]
MMVKRSIIAVITFAGICTAAGASEAISAGDVVSLTLPGDIKLELVRIPSGSFKMGSAETERGRYKDEGPAHTVNINYDFYMGKYEVTQAQWMSVMEKNPVYRYGIGDNYPISHVSWNMCQQFIAKLNQLGVGTFRLPSEAEWEYACRAGTQSRFYFGDSLKGSDTCDDYKAGSLSGNRSQYMWYCGNNGIAGKPDFGAKPVGQLKPNAFGLYDMHGNVWEWCLDQYHPDYNGAPTDGRLWLDWAGAPRVLRGGGWDYHARNCRSTVRCGYSETRGYTFHGMRLVWFPYEKKSEQWFKTWQAEVIGDNIVSYQSGIGAWPKNMRMETHGYQGEKFTKNWGTTIDNGATIREMDYLAQLYWATGKKRFKDSFNKGLNWLLEAQYDNGGWPQRYPLTHDTDYGDYITFNDDAITNVLRLMDKILDNKDSDLLSPQRRELVKKAYHKGIECILKCQVVIDGKRTVWGQQHDPKTLIPRPAREYEPSSLCGRESVGILIFLMNIESPPKEIVQAIEDGIAWFKSSKITGYRIDGEKGLVKDPNAPAMWARFYEIESGRPIFGTYDGKVKYSLAEILKERHPSYGWYTREGEQAIKEYAEWKKKMRYSHFSSGGYYGY